MEKLIPSPVTSIEEQATGQVPVSHGGKCIDYAICKGVPCQVLTKRADDFSYFMKQTDGEYRHFFAVISSAYEVEVKKILGLCA